MIDAPSPDPVIEQLVAELRRRSAVGLQKYGVPLSRGDLTLKDWLKLALEETLDKAGYLQCAINNKAVIGICNLCGGEVSISDTWNAISLRAISCELCGAAIDQPLSDISGYPILNMRTNDNIATISHHHPTGQ